MRSTMPRKGALAAPRGIPAPGGQVGLNYETAPRGIPSTSARHVSRTMWMHSTRRTATSMPAPAAGTANSLAVLGRTSRPQPQPLMH